MFDASNFHGEGEGGDNEGDTVAQFTLSMDDSGMCSIEWGATDDSARACLVQALRDMADDIEQDRGDKLH